MLKYTKGLGAGMTFFALWVLMGTHELPDPVVGDKTFDIEELKIANTMLKPMEGKNGRVYFRDKRSCEKLIKLTRQLSVKGDNRITFHDPNAAFFYLGFCVKASEL